ncbi:hypothetical protein, partial [Mycetohabitans sp. B6]|uniref:hypothetical protein n=1 Tax=Mycetohabitans sp. B6 TaxID=2841843 RepID=UPI00351D2536|nr:hypothetical protein [Mycetohabitans sp. B6]
LHLGEDQLADAGFGKPLRQSDAAKAVRARLIKNRIRFRSDIRFSSHRTIPTACRRSAGHGGWNTIALSFPAKPAMNGEATRPCPSLMGPWNEYRYSSVTRADLMTRHRRPRGHGGGHCLERNEVHATHHHEPHSKHRLPSSTYL